MICAKNPPAWFWLMLLASVLFAAWFGYQAVRIHAAIAHFERGLSSLESHDYATGIVELRKAVRAKPDFAAGHRFLAGALADTGARQEAIQHYRRAILLLPHYPEAYYDLADTLSSEGQRAEARRIWQRVAAMDNAYYARKARQRLAAGQ